MEYRILHIEDSKTDADLVKRLIIKSGLNARYHLASDRDEVFEAFNHFDPNIILCDHSLPSFNSKMAYSICKEKDPDLPFILVTGTVSEEFAVEMLKTGVDDYLLKTNLQRLPVAIENAVSIRERDKKLKSFQNNLQQSEIHLRTIFENSSNALLLLNKDFIVIEFNSLMAKCSEIILGNSYQIDQNILDVLPSDRRESVKNNLEKVLNGETISYETEYNLDKIGSVFYLVNMNHVNDAEGKIKGICISVTDITKQKKADQSVRESEKKYRNLIEYASDAIFVYAVDGTIHEFNKTCYTMLGYTSEEYAKLELTDIFAGDIIVNTDDRSALHAGETITLKRILMRKDGSLLETEVSEKTLEDGKIIAFARDITERKKAEDAILFTLKEKNTILESIGDAFFAIDKDWVVTYWNNHAEKMLGVSKKDIVGRNLWEVFKDSIDSEPYRKYHEAVETNQVIQFENFYMPMNRWHEISAYPSEDALSVYFKDITERKKSEEKIKESEARLAASQSVAKVGSWETDLTNLDVIWSDETCRIFGVDNCLPHTSHENFLKFVHPDDREKVDKAFVASFTSDSLNSIEHRIISADGILKDVEERWLIAKDENGKAIRALGTVQDITERKKATKTQYELHTRLKAIFEKTNDAIMLADDSGNYVQVNPATAKMLGYSQQELTGMNTADIISGRQTDELWNEFMQDGSQTGAIELVRKDGSLVICHYNANSNILPGLHLSILTDITEQKKAENAVKESEAKFRAFFENSMDGILLTVTDGEILAANPAACKIFNMTEQEICDAGRFGLVDLSDPRNENLIKERQLTGKAQGELTLLRKDRTPFAGEISSVLFTDSFGQQRTSMIIRDISERKKVEETSLRLGSIVESSREAIVSFSLEGLIVTWNYAAKVLYEYSSEEVLGKPYTILLHLDYVDQFTKNVERVKAGEQPGHFELEQVLKNGKLIYVSLSISPVKNAAGNINGIAINAHDISKQKIAEVVLKQANHKAKTWRETKVKWELAICITLALLLLFLSVHFDLPEKISTLIGNPTNSIIDDIIIVITPFLFLVIIFGIRRFQDHHKDGQAIQIALRTLTNELEMRIQERTNDLSKSNEVLLNEIIKRKKTGENLKQSEERLKEAQAIARISNWEIDLVTNAHQWSHGFYDILRIKPEEVKPSAEAFLSLLHPDDVEQAKESIQKTFDTFKESFFYSRVNTNDGIVRFVYSEWKFEFDKTNKPIRLYGILQDVTERKLAEERLKKQASELAISNAELEQFAYVASHDLQEPLRMITGFLSQLEKKYGDTIDEKGKKYIAFAVDGAMRMRQIILDLLKYSQIGRTQDEKEELDLNELLDEIKILLRNKIEDKNALITIDHLPGIYNYRSPIRQVFQNLISNALEYSRKDASVKIHVAVKELKDHWQFAVIDNGIGIEKEYFDKIFIIFQRLHNKEEYSGTGMGLAITKKIIDTQAGKIWVESEEGKGSTFNFTIPKILK